MMVKIRPAEVQDVDAIFELILGLAAYEQLTDRVTGNSDLLRSHLFGARPYAESIVADLDGSIPTLPSSPNQDYISKMSSSALNIAVKGLAKH
jgi:hypothetical protein